MKTKQCLAFGLLFILLGCVVKFDDNIRVKVKGNVVDTDGLAIPNANVSVTTRRSSGSYFFGSSGEDEYVLGSGFSNSDGVFSLTSVFDSRGSFTIEIDAGNIYSRYTYNTNTTDYEPPNLTFNLQTINLRKLATVNYRVIRTSGEGNSISYTFSYKDRDCIEVYDEGVLNVEESRCFEAVSFGRTLNDNLPDIENSFNSLLGSSVDFTYSINNQPEVTETFTINEENYEFTFIY